MNKRIIAILCVIVLMATSLTACNLFGGGGNKTTVNGIEVEEQQYHSGSSHSLFLIMTNKTGNDCDLEITVNFVDANGNTVDTVSGHSIYAFGKDTTIAEQFYSDAAYTTCNYNIMVKPLSYYRPVDADLKATINPMGEDVAISVTNNGTAVAEFVEFYILYYQNNVLVDYDWGYCDDDDSEVKPGATVTREEHCYEAYDNATIYVHGKIDD